MTRPREPRSTHTSPYLRGRQPRYQKDPSSAAGTFAASIRLARSSAPTASPSPPISREMEHTPVDYIPRRRSYPLVNSSRAGRLHHGTRLLRRCYPTVEATRGATASVNVRVIQLKITGSQLFDRWGRRGRVRRRFIAVTAICDGGLQRNRARRNCARRRFLP